MTTPQMLWEEPTFPFTRYLESQFEAILAEARCLTVEDYDMWPQQEGYTGAWKTYVFFSRDQTWHLSGLCAEHAKRLPKTYEVVSRIQGVERAGFSMMLPGTHIIPHSDGKNGELDLLRCHLGIFTNPKSGMRVAGTTIHWGPGKCMVFDGQAEHEAANFGAEPRVVLILDVDRDKVDLPVSGG
jgi:beta-hydroxylase